MRAQINSVGPPTRTIQGVGSRSTFVADPDYPRLRHAIHLTVYESLQRSGSFSGENHQKSSMVPLLPLSRHWRDSRALRRHAWPSASLSPWVVGLFAPDAVTTDIFFWTLSVGGEKRLAPKAPFLLFSRPQHCFPSSHILLISAGSSVIS
jgi:hypothetical protein